MPGSPKLLARYHCQSALPHVHYPPHRGFPLTCRSSPRNGTPPPVRRVRSSRGHRPVTNPLRRPRREETTPMPKTNSPKTNLLFQAHIHHPDKENRPSSSREKNLLPTYFSRAFGRDSLAEVWFSLASSRARHATTATPCP